MTKFELVQIAFSSVNIIVLCVTAFYVAKSPVDAVKIGRKLNTEQQKDNAKRSLFLTLFSLRGSPLNYDFVTGLNQIDIVFEDTPSVLNAWHIHYDSLNSTGLVDAENTWNIQRVNLLSEMAQSLGYERIRQTDMLQNYTPVGHNDELQKQWDMRDAQLTFYKVTSAMNERIMQRMDEQDRDAEGK